MNGGLDSVDDDRASIRKAQTKQNVIVALTVLEIIFFSACMIITLTAPPRSDGWIPSDFISRPLSFVYLVLHMILVPRQLYRALEKNSGDGYAKLGYLILAFLLLAIPERGPWSWRFHEIVNYEEKKPEDLAMYARLLDDLAVIRTDKLSIRNSLPDEYYDCAVTEALRDKIAAALREAPAEYLVPRNNERLNKNDDFHFSIQTFEQEGLGPDGVIDFYYSYDEYWVDSLALEADGTTLVEVFFWDIGRFYLTIENKYLYEIFTALPGYKFDYSVRDRFLYEDLPNAKAGYCYRFQF
jgi:hypothetical protein